MLRFICASCMFHRCMAACCITCHSLQIFWLGFMLACFLRPAFVVCMMLGFSCFWGLIVIQYFAMRYDASSGQAISLCQHRQTCYLVYWLSLCDLCIQIWSLHFTYIAVHVCCHMSGVIEALMLPILPLGLHGQISCRYALSIRGWLDVGIMWCITCHDGVWCDTCCGSAHAMLVCCVMVGVRVGVVMLRTSGLHMLWCRPLLKCCCVCPSVHQVAYLFLASWRKRKEGQKAQEYKQPGSLKHTN